MKRTVLGVIAILLLLGCASIQPEPAQSLRPTSESNVEVRAQTAVIDDWMGRMARAPAIPQWIEYIHLYRFEDAANLLQDRGVGNSIYRGLNISGPDLRGAQMRADANFARQIARELHQQINVHLAEDTNQSMNDATRTAIGERTQIVSEVQVSGARLVAEFWQNVIVTDSLSGRRTRQTQLYRIYAFQNQDWAAITGGYVQKILEGLPNRLQPEEQAVREMLQSMLNASRHPVVMTQREREAELEAQQRMIDAQINLMPAQQRDAARIELARINSETAITLGQQRADASVARVDALAASRAEQTAYASGNPVLRSAAATTVADRDLVNAARLAQMILF